MALACWESLYDGWDNNSVSRQVPKFIISTLAVDSSVPLTRTPSTGCHINGQQLSLYTTRNLASRKNQVNEMREARQYIIAPPVGVLIEI